MENQGIDVTTFLYKRRLQDVFRTSWSRPIYSSWPYVFKTSSRRFGDVLSRCLHEVLKTSSRRLAKTSSRRFEDVFKTSSRYLQDVFKTFSRRLQEIFKTSSRGFEDVFMTSSRHLQDALQRYLQDVFKAYHQVKPFLLTRLREVFNTFLRHYFSKMVIYRWICLGNTTSEKFMVSEQNLQEIKRLLKF